MTYTPSSRYLGKLLTVMALIAVLVLAVGVIIAWLVGRDEGPRAGGTALVVFVLVDLLWFVPAVLLAVPYFRSLKYEIQDDEVIVRVGIWTKSVKHVPYRTVTNLKTNRDIFDRWLFGLGSLNIQTAGMSGSTGAEEALVGLPDVEGVYKIVRDKLRRYRGAMAPDAAGVEGSPGTGVGEAVLAELRAIRAAVEK